MSNNLQKESDNIFDRFVTPCKIKASEVPDPFIFY